MNKYIVIAFSVLVLASTAFARAGSSYSSSSFSSRSYSAPSYSRSSYSAPSYSKPVIYSVAPKVTTPTPTVASSTPKVVNKEVNVTKNITVNKTVNTTTASPSYQPIPHTDMTPWYMMGFMALASNNHNQQPVIVNNTAPQGIGGQPAQVVQQPAPEQRSAWLTIVVGLLQISIFGGICYAIYLAYKKYFSNKGGGMDV